MITKLLKFITTVSNIYARFVENSEKTKNSYLDYIVGDIPMEESHGVIYF